MNGKHFGLIMLAAVGVALIPLAASAAKRETVTLTPGTILTRTAQVKPGEYLLPSDDETGKTASVTIRGDNLTIDFANAILRGTAPETLPDARKGTAIRVEGRNVTIKRLRVHGYKIGLFAQNCPGLRVLDSDLSYNWKQHLKSTPERENLDDWMSYHHNEANEWLRYGAALYLDGCDGFEVKNVRVRGGQCGLMLPRSNKGLVWNCDFSYLSGIGVGLYRSSENRVLHNKIDWCVRGYSHGVYNRGQDSAGILVFEQCNKNLFAYNSVTHGGDGFFLWAGQTTMDTGQGGCNDNLLYGNDFSFAPTNGIEVTFSRNKIVSNWVEGCDHGVWGGYSYDTLILRNYFQRNNRGVAIEHGQHNVMRGNRFWGDNEAIVLWQNAKQDPDWGYPKHHDTVSHDYKIEYNYFEPVKTAFSLRDTRDVRFYNNYVEARSAALLLTGATPGLNFEENYITELAPDAAKGFDPNSVTKDYRPGEPVAPLGNEPSTAAGGYWSHIGKNILYSQRGTDEEALKYEPKLLKGGQDALAGSERLRGREAIIVDEWGPYDFQSPRLVLQRPTKPEADAQGRTVYRFDVLGPKGAWKVKQANGAATVSAQSGMVPGTLTITLEAGKAVNLDLQLEYTGGATTDFRGITTPAAKPVPFGYTRFFAPIAWNVRWFGYTPENDPQSQPTAFAKLVTDTKPIVEQKTDRLDYAGYGAFVKGVPAAHFVTIADGAFTVPEGDYTLEITTDDGCRVALDGKTVLDSWKYQGPTTYTVDAHLGGSHKLHVEHFQIDGYAALQIRLLPKR